MPEVDPSAGSRGWSVQAGLRTSHADPSDDLVVLCNECFYLDCQVWHPPTQPLECPLNLVRSEGNPSGAQFDVSNGD